MTALQPHDTSPSPVTSAPTYDVSSALRVAPYRQHDLPLVVRPADRTHRRTLDDVVRDHALELREWLRRHGAVLFRGFDVRGSAGFESSLLAFTPELGTDYLGTSPRDRLSKHVFTASELPGHFPIPQHLEMSFLSSPPRWLFFHALAPNTTPGGQTPLADFRRVLRDLDPDVRERFRQRGVRNVRRYAGPAQRRTFDPWQLKRWDEMFGTEDREAVERKARAQGQEPTWSADGTLTLTSTQPAFRAHPETGELVWSNHVQVFHPSAAAAELARVAQRTRSLRTAAVAGLAAVLTRARHRLGRPAPMDVTFGDGSPISDADAGKVRDAIWKNLVAFRWQRDDVLFVDNASVSHGRFPYRGPRTVTVAWA